MTNDELAAKIERIAKRVDDVGKPTGWGSQPRQLDTKQTAKELREVASSLRKQPAPPPVAE